MTIVGNSISLNVSIFSLSEGPGKSRTCNTLLYKKSLRERSLARI